MNLSRAYFLYKALAHNQHLQSRRHPMFEKNRVMKLFSYVFIAFMAAYLSALGVSLYTFFEHSSFEAFDCIDGGMIWFLLADFLLRFFLQETPAQNIKQYKLLNIPTGLMLHTFLFRMGLQPYNLFWAFFFVPFGFLAIPQFYGIVGLIGFLIGWWLVFILNSYWYLFWRTLVNRYVPTILIPLLIYALLIYFGIFFDENAQWLFRATIRFMRGYIQWHPLVFVFFGVAVVPLYYVNYRLQQVAIYVEIAKAEVVKSFKTRNMVFLDKFGIIGEYLKLEIKSTMRNLVVRKQFLIAAGCMLMLCSLFSFSHIYDSLPFMRIFICVYCFNCLGVMTLTTVMCAEGNYIDGLMVHKETVLSLLKAKYYFQCLMLVVPFLFSLMPIIEGKMTWMTALGCLLFTTGVVFPFIFQLAVYNDTSIHLNKKLTRTGRDTKVQMLMSGIAMFLPMFIMWSLVDLWGDQTAAVVMAAIGLLGTITHPLWLKNIYKRFMQRRYQNMEGFRSSR